MQVQKGGLSGLLEILAGGLGGGREPSYRTPGINPHAEDSGMDQSFYTYGSKEEPEEEEDATFLELVQKVLHRPRAQSLSEFFADRAGTKPQNFSRGSYARGPGDGRSDEIEARLSDGEYVMDAETVSLLGNGSSDAGARRLDEMRKNLRKHKGKALQRGRFSADAKKPEDYLR